MTSSFDQCTVCDSAATGTWTGAEYICDACRVPRSIERPTLHAAALFGFLDQSVNAR
jgi:hypothetical protein